MEDIVLMPMVLIIVLVHHSGLTKTVQLWLHTVQLLTLLNIVKTEELVLKMTKEELPLMLMETGNTFTM